jgi:hypothetical protein
METLVMNKRIQELEKQSYTEVMHEMGGTYMAFDKEKFAELIVRECISALDYADGSVHHSECLLEHFGVAE